MTDPLNRKPWPMKWVVLAIIACIIPYTIITLKYRKPSPAYQPYEDSKQRANVLRLLDAGFRRIHVTAGRPADPGDVARQMGALAETTAAPGGLPGMLADTLVETPPLPVSVNDVSAPRETASLLPYPVLFTCAHGDNKHQLGGAQVYVRGRSVVIVPVFETVAGDLATRTRESPVLVTIPSGALESGETLIHLVGSETSRKWTVFVR